ncbi:MAG TPA: 2OG-Fe(II) oxygenase family protein [Kofleriaceae bacterium]
MSATLPVFALDELEHDDQVARLAAACEQLGFFYLSAYGIDPALERALEAASAAFFARPLADKLQIAMTRGGAAWRGYFPVGGELTSGQPDIKEGLYFGEDLPAEDPRVVAGWPMHGQSLYPDQPGEPLVQAYMQAQAAIGQRVLRGLARALDLPASYFADQLTHRPTQLFRIFHYPAGAADGAWGVGEHTDYGLLTLLKQDARGGLEVKTPAGWIDAPPLPGTLVCNLGDMLDRLTGGRFRSTPHRVRNRSGASRYSWPFFLDPAFDARVAPLPGASVRPADVDAAQRWDRASVHTLTGCYGDYLLAKVAKVFPGLAAGAIRF